MKSYFDFNQDVPPVLNEAMLRRALEKRTRRRYALLLSALSLLWSALFCALSLLLLYNRSPLGLPVLLIWCSGLICSGVVAVVFCTKRSEIVRV